MTFQGGKLAIALTMSIGALSSVQGQEAPAAAPAAAAPHPGRDLTMGKCFQCHTDAMWRDQRQDERAWQATLYRMKARGAVWTDDDIKTMAAFLSTDFGPSSPRAKPSVR